MNSGSSRDDGNGPFARQDGLRDWLRLLGALHGLALFAAATITPHRHLNPLDDLLSDGPSDSGILFEQRGAGQQEPGCWFRAVCLLDDDPCLACFHNDYKAVAETVPLFLPAPSLVPLAQAEGSATPAEPAAPASPKRSRAPPPIA